MTSRAERVHTQLLRIVERRVEGLVGRADGLQNPQQSLNPSFHSAELGFFRNTALTCLHFECFCRHGGEFRQGGRLLGLVEAYNPGERRGAPLREPPAMMTVTARKAIANRSASRAIGAFERCAASTKRTMPA